MRTDAFAEGLVRKHRGTFNAFEVEKSPDLTAVADWFVRTYSGPNAFICDLQRRLFSGRGLTIFQSRGALNVFRADLLKETRWKARPVGA